MPLTNTYLIDMARLSVKRPQVAAKTVMTWPLNRGEVLAVLAAMAIISTLVTEAIGALVDVSQDPAAVALLSRPMAFAAVQFVGLILLSGLIAKVGGWFGGTGTVDQSLALMAWLQVILLAAQLVQFVTMLVLPPLAMVVGLVSFGLYLWLLTGFTAGLHGFASLGRTFAGLILGGFGAILVLTVIIFVLLMLGIIHV